MGLGADQRVECAVTRLTVVERTHCPVSRKPDPCAPQRLRECAAGAGAVRHARPMQCRAAEEQNLIVHVLILSHGLQCSGASLSPREAGLTDESTIEPRMRVGVVVCGKHGIAKGLRVNGWIGFDPFVPRRIRIKRMRERQ